MTTLVHSMALGEPAPQPPTLPCTDHPALQQLAQRWLQQAPGNISVLEADLRAHNITAPTVRAFRSTAPATAALHVWLHRHAKQSDAPLLCGHAQRAAGHLTVIASAAAAIQPQKNGMSVTLHPSFHHATIMAIDHAGDIAIFAPNHHQASSWFIPMQTERFARIQVIAQGRHGLRPVATWRLSPYHLIPVQRAQRQWLKRLAPPSTQLRQEKVAARLRPHRLLQQLAQAHATETCQRGQARHQSWQRQHNPNARLRAAGLRTVATGEVVASLPQDSQPWSQLLRSPSHRATLLDRRFTDVGIGTSHNQHHQQCLVVLLAAWPRAL